MDRSKWQVVVVRGTQRHRWQEDSAEAAEARRKSLMTTGFRRHLKNGVVRYIPFHKIDSVEVRPPRQTKGGA